MVAFADLGAAAADFLTAVPVDFGVERREPFFGSPGVASGLVAGAVTPNDTLVAVAAVAAT